MTARSPLTGGTEVSLVLRRSAASLVDAWRKGYGIDVGAAFRGCEGIELYRCERTGLLFFRPGSAAGGPELYEQLSRLDWYYLADKWEYDEALRDLAGAGEVVEVGCGRGAFLERVAAAGARAVGIETNPAGVAEARSKGLAVEAADLAEYAARNGGRFDAACCFQVLEHVPEPRPFLEAMIALVRPGGRIVLSVPNAGSFIRHAGGNLLDMPPHHMTRWRAETFGALPGLFPLRLERIALEPLAPYHVDWFLAVEGDRLPGGLAGRVGRAALDRLARPALRRSPALRRRIDGHTLYACLERLPGAGPPR